MTSARRYGSVVPQYQRTVWWNSAAPRPAPRTLTTDITADIAVIGAGFTGLTAALHLARAGARVVVLEADAIGAGASGLNAGFVVPNFAKADPAAVIARLGRERGERLLSMIGAGADRVFATIRDHDIACDAEQVGWMHVAHSPAMAEVLARRAEAWRDLGRPVSMLDEASARARSGLKHCVGALLDVSGGMLHPLNYAYGLAGAVTTLGGQIYERCPVGRIERAGHGWRLGCGERTVHAEQVLLCTNAFEQGAARRLGRSTVPLTVYQIATQPIDAAIVRRISPQRNPVADTRANLMTYRLDRDNRLISGGMAIVPVRAEERMARMIVGRLQRELALPETPEAAFVWRGTAAMTTDFLPHLYEFGPGFLGGIGCNGRGIALTAMLGEVMAAAAGGARLQDLPIGLARPGRIPMRMLAVAAPSFAIAQARWQDKQAGL
ncbi:NAD(P)/FAD-dependent oxidoreductase [Chelatococcus asaccharovorans]|uniref:NAD(P)/FAD-dependent oxidoreductase n=1 Tax=Chelatococcus asaccharovorans TaxID=28210 RepID=UPI00224C72CA|nr:FAD-binding oxidoreductase [Chelatococcus asaccharovorans]CAH1661020.1 Glycine/D-amino acid oxidase-like deaminating enzyme [Chelatococcus asaccharovorans]CAH1683599.1 Glycine/D-amino acid oxidase-like deaminating enzyme [Chelatococcus asaccharovorans]